MTGSPAAGLVRGWVRLYTSGLPPKLRDARRDEVDDDLWCEHEEAAEAGRSRRALGTDLVLRLLFGIPADVSWRLTSGRRAPAPTFVRTPSMGARAVGASAIVAVLGFGFLGILTSTLGPDMGTTGGSPSHIGMVVGAIVLCCIAFLVAALGTALLYRDRVGPLGGFGALVMTLGALTVIGAGLADPLFVGSAMLMVDLARVGVVSRLVPIVHVATAILFVSGVTSGQATIDPGGLRNWLSAVSFTFWMATWGAIGVSLIRGVRKAQAPSA
jgi:hypothetical protein